MIGLLKKFKKLETSKKLITVVTIVWILSLIVGYLGIIFGYSFLNIINLVNIDFLVILGYYFTKAGSENYFKNITNTMQGTIENAEETPEDFIDNENYEDIE